MLIWANMGGLEKRHTSLLHFPMKHGIMITDNKIELSSLSESNTQQGHQNGYQDYPYSVLQLMFV